MGKADHAIRQMASETVILGQTGITTSSLALGCARLGSVMTPLGPRESLVLLQRALSLGIRHFDTASVYGQGESERLIGRAVRGCRGEVCIATKAGQRLTVAQAVAARFKIPLWLAKHVLRYARGSRSGAKPDCISALSRFFSNARSSGVSSV
jgi:aryl-alcohol dehydrogenase-like predicted oxidoreductase